MDARTERLLIAETWPALHFARHSVPDQGEVYVGGFRGQLVSGCLWLLSAAAATWGSLGAGVATLLVGGILIFPVTTLPLKLSGSPPSFAPGHPMRAIAMQIAVTGPARS